MNEETVAAWARMLGVKLPQERVEQVAASLEGQIAQRGGLAPQELEHVEPAAVFEPDWAEE
jgi:hypothetical protein